jgi:hypothetical protein
MSKTFTLAAGLLLVGMVHAQPANPLDAVPEKMPFDLP